MTRAVYSRGLGVCNPLHTPKMPCFFEIFWGTEDILKNEPPPLIIGCSTCTPPPLCLSLDTTLEIPCSHLQTETCILPNDGTKPQHFIGAYRLTRTKYKIFSFFATLMYCILLRNIPKYNIIKYVMWFINTTSELNHVEWLTLNS